MKLLAGLFRTFYAVHIKLHTSLVRPSFLLLNSEIRPQVDITNPEFISIGKNVEIRPHTWIYAIKNDLDRQNVFTPTIEIRDGVKIGRFCQITCSNRLVIEEDVFITEGVLITDSTHGYEDVTIPIVRQSLISRGPIIIGSGSWIGNGARIVGKVTIGQHAVIGTNSFVDRDVPDYAVMAGTPARIIKRYDFDQKAWVKV